jgi:hypothetical protein
MVVRKPTTSDIKRLLRIYAGDDLNPDTYTVWFEGRDMRVTRKEGESSAELWSRVCGTVEHMRQVVHRGCLRGRVSAFAHVYAGITPTEADERERMREWIVWSLWQLTDPRQNNDHIERVQALCLLADLFGIMPPQKTSIEIRVS